MTLPIRTGAASGCGSTAVMGRNSIQQAGGARQQIPLNPEYQAIFEANLGEFWPRGRSPIIRSSAACRPACRER